MKVLFISDGLSLKTGQGVGARRNLSIVKGLSSDILIYSLEDGRTTQCIDDVNYIGYNVTFFKKIYDLLNFRYYYSKETEYLILEQTLLFKPDIVFIDSSNLGNISRKISKINPNIITYFIDFNLIKIFEMLFKNGPKQIFHIYALFFNEIFSILYSKAAFMLTNREKNLLLKFYSKLKVYILPITIEDKFNDKIDINKIISPTNKILFVGAKYYPNIIGINLFLKNVFPSLKEHELILVGKDLNKANIKFNKNDKNRVTILSNVSDLELQNLYKNTNIVICPIFHGGGMKIKFAESLMHGKVIVASKFAAEGFDNIDSNDIYIADHINNFLNKIIIASETISYKIKFSETNRKLYLNNFMYKNSISVIKEATSFVQS